MSTVNVSPRSDLSVEFLQRWLPGGPWVLTSIEPERKAISTATFTDGGEALKWIQQYNGERNIYFHVNPTMEAMTKKAERTDIRELSWLHVDIDPRAGEDIEAERDRALKLLRGYKVPPTVIVDSGGGYQGFWRLQDPVPVNGDVNAAEDAKRYNIQLELDFGADNCHNIDRIMRLPGTINIPDARKKKKGRVAALASVVEFTDLSYPVATFMKAPEVQTATDTGFAGTAVQISGNVNRIKDIDDLGETVPGRIKVMIVQGGDPDEPHKYSSRSEMLFAVVTSLVRAGITDDVIYAVITDPDFGISQSVLEKKNWQKYAIRQIERAREEAIHPKLRELNEQFAVIGDMGGKCRIISEVWDTGLKRSLISKQSFEDFRNRFMHIQIEVGTDSNGKSVFKKMGNWWLEHPLRRQYDTITFSPGQHTENAYNLWRGYACEPKPGDCSKFLAHIKDNICSGNQEYYDYYMGWMARAVQHPDSQGEVAVVLRGKMGTGKGVAARNFGELFGRHFLQIADSKHLTGNFNSHLRDCVVLFADEAFYAGDKKHESILKSLITEPTITIEAKGVDAVPGPNHTHIIMASNSAWVVPAGSDERRYFVLDVGSDQKQNHAYFEAIAKEWGSGGKEALLHLLMTMDLSQFNVRRVPQTQALQEQKEMSMQYEVEWFFSKLQEGRLLSSHVRWEGAVEKEELYQDFYSYMQRMGAPRRASKTALHRFLEKAMPKNGLQVVQRWAERKETDNRTGITTYRRERPYFFTFPALEDCRVYWEQEFGKTREWMKIDESVQEEMEREGTPF